MQPILSMEADILSIIKLTHGGGGRESDILIKDVFIKNFFNDILNEMEDAAVLDLEIHNRGKLAFTTDSFIVKPIFFPGGDIGRLAVCGTVNDLLMRGATPLYLSVSFIIEEGFDYNELEKISASMAEACREAKVKIVAGDTKVVEKGAADGIFINTSGIGIIPEGVNISIRNAKPGDVVIISGTIGDHGIAVMTKREGLEFQVPVNSDVAPLIDMVSNLLELKEAIKVLRDPTRGGVAEVLHEIALGSGVGIEIYEECLPINKSVAAACSLLGFDCLELANEGKIMAVVSKEKAEQALDIIKASPYGEKAAIIGQVNDSGMVTIRTAFNVSRMIARPTGEALPRIC